MKKDSIELETITHSQSRIFFLEDYDNKDFKNLDVLFTRRDKLLSRLISRFTKSKFSHCAIVIKTEQGTFVVDSQKNGTNIKEFSIWQKEYEYDIVRVRPEFHVMPFRPNHVKSRIYDVMGVTGYDFRSLLITQPLYILTGKWFGRRNKRAKKRMYCSEFVAYAFHFDKFWKMSPGKLYNEMAKSGQFHLIDKK